MINKMKREGERGGRRGEIDSLKEGKERLIMLLLIWGKYEKKNKS